MNNVSHRFDGKQIVVTGGSGLLGSAMKAMLESFFPGALVHAPSSWQMDLMNYDDTHDFVNLVRPELVLHCAGTVGGIVANRDNPWRFLTDNARMALNVVEACRKCDVPSFGFMGSACVYPADATSPIREGALYQGPPQRENQPYGIAKWLGIEATRICYDEGRDYTTFMPCNLFGRNDNYDPIDSHVIPGLFYKIARTKELGGRVVKCWGNGTARRDFLAADDAAYMILRYFCRKNRKGRRQMLNITSEVDYQIQRVAGYIKNIVYPEAELVWGDATNNGQATRFLSSRFYEATMTAWESDLEPICLRSIYVSLERLWKEQLSKIPTDRWKQKSVATR